ncbi:polysaccharide deacetylase family protein [Modicisalibacter luteus]
MQLGQVNPQRLSSVTQQLCQEFGQPNHGLDPFSIRRLESGGLIRFGARGVDFTAFELQSEERIRWQVQRSRRTLARLCREPLPILAYPDERPSPRVQQVVQRCGVQAALAADGGWLTHRSNRLALPRIAIAQPIAHSPGRLFDYLLGKL